MGGAVFELLQRMQWVPTEEREGARQLSAATPGRNQYLPNSALSLSLFPPSPPHRARASEDRMQNRKVKDYRGLARLGAPNLRLVLWI